MQLRERLCRDTWLQRRAAHHARLLPFVDAHRQRVTRGERHPVYDFLFTYYSFSGGQLLRWTPGLGVDVELSPADELEWPDHMRRCDGCFALDPCQFPIRRLPFLRWAITFLETTLERPPVFHCFGLHEWAMLYKAPQTRYPNVPLRVDAAELDRVVEAGPLRCTHYDAFRFFTEEAAPLNRDVLRADTVTANDQPGCVHATMDLYRLAYKVAPFVPSALVADLFLLARDARELDMRAAPYDLSAFGFSPIPIESKEGREEYVDAQRALCERALPFRSRLLDVYRELLAAVLNAHHNPGFDPEVHGSAARHE